MLASARAMGSLPGDPSLPAQTLGSTSARGAEGAFHAWPHPASLLSQACPQVWVQGCGTGSCFSVEGLGNLGLLRALSPPFRPHFDSLSIFRPFLSPFLRISE